MSGQPSPQRASAPRSNFEFVPLAPMRHRLELAKSDSDTAYFFDLMYYGEYIVKLVCLGVVAGLNDEKERHRYRLEHRLVRADGIGEWVSSLDDALVGPASQVLRPAAKEEQRIFTEQAVTTSGEWRPEAVRRLNAVLNVVNPDLEALPAKVSLRKWFNLFAALRNRTRGHGTVTSRTCSKVCTDLEASLHLVADNLPLFSRSWAYLHRNLSGKYRVIRLGGERRPFEFLLSQSHYTYADGAYVFFDEPAAARLLMTDVDLSAFLVPNGGFKGEAFETLSYATDEKRQIDIHDFAAPPTPLPPSETEGLPTLELVGKTFTNTPPPPSDYVARLQLEDQLLTVLRDDRHPVVTLTGRGGIGKTSVTLTVLRRIAHEGGFFSIAWCSARDIDLLAHGPKIVSPRVLTRDDLASYYVALMSPSKRGEKNFVATEYLAEELANRNTDEPVLFVIDNFETVRNPIDLYAWLDNVIRLPNKLLLTSRFREFKGDYSVDVGGMTEPEFEVLVSSTTARLNIGNIIPDGYWRQLHEETDGHPYIAKVVLGEAASTGRLPSVGRLMAGKDDILDALFERSYQMMTPAAQRAFLTVCSWRSMVPRLALEAALLRPANETMGVSDAVDALQRSSLIESVTAGDGEEFLRAPLAAAEFGRRRLAVSPIKSAVEADSKILQAFGPATGPDLIHGLKARVARLVSHISDLQTRGEPVDDFLPVLEYVARHYTPGWLMLADLYAERVSMQGGRLAAESVRRYLEQNPSDGEAWQKLAHISTGIGDVQGEIQARIELAQLPAASMIDISNAANRLNAVLAEKQLAVDSEERRVLIGHLKTVMITRIQEADATDCSRLAWLCLYLQDYDGANAYVDRGLGIEPDNRFCLRLVDTLKEYRRPSSTRKALKDSKPYR
jgi:hypothetical protein